MQVSIKHQIVSFALCLILISVLVPTAAAQEHAFPRLTVMAEALNVRAGPGITYPVVDVLLKNSQVNITGRHAISGWWQVELSGNP